MSSSSFFLLSPPFPNTIAMSNSFFLGKIQKQKQKQKPRSQTENKLKK